MSNAADPNSSLPSQQTSPATTEAASIPAEAAKPAPSPEGAGAVGTTATETVTPLSLADLMAPEGFSLTSKEVVDGKEVEKPIAGIEDFVGLANELKLGKDGANKLLAFHNQFLQSAADEYLARWEKTEATWKKQCQELPEFGGAAFEGTLQSISKVLDRYGDKEVREAFALTGAGNHPAVVRFIAKMAKDLNEATPVRGQTGSSPKDRAERMYGKT